MSKIRVIVVNDEKEVGWLWQRLLNASTQVDCVGVAYNGEEGIEMARTLQPDIVLMDVMMPGMHGLDATRQIIDTVPNTLVVIFSARQDLREQALATGAVEWLLLPVMPDDLVTTIQRIYSEHQKGA